MEIHPAAAAGKGILTTLQLLLQQVPDVIVQGIPAVDRAVVNTKQNDKGRSACASSLLLYVAAADTLCWATHQHADTCSVSATAVT